MDEEMKKLVADAIAKAIVGDQDPVPKDRMFVDGEKVLIRTVTFTAVGRVVKENSLAVWLENASWVALTGRFSEALSTGELSEVEVCPSTRRVAIGSIVDVDPWDHALPTQSK